MGETLRDVSELVDRHNDIAHPRPKENSKARMKAVAAHPEDLSCSG